VAGCEADVRFFHLAQPALHYHGICRSDHSLVLVLSISIACHYTFVRIRYAHFFLAFAAVSDATFR
jgi:hypothetical protein